MSGLFGDEIKRLRRPLLDVLPVSVIDVAAQEDGRQRRETGGHDDESSRAQFSHFPSEVGDLCFQLFLAQCETIYDPFAGWGERAALATAYGKHYIGVDVSPAAIHAARETYGETNILGDSRTLPAPSFDGMLTCPPYWNLETYSEHGIENAPTWSEFIEDLNAVFSRAYEAALSGAIFCVQVGDWREAHEYYALTYCVQRMFIERGARIVDSVVVNRKGITKIKIMIPQAVRLGYTVKVHETLLVFRKP